MSLNDDSIEMLMHLCRIYFTEEEKYDLKQKLSEILKFIQQLNEVDTEDVSSCDHVLENVHNVMREDIVGELLKREVFLENAPSHIGGMIKIPPVMKSEE